MRTIFLGVVAILVYGVLTTSVQAAVPTPQQNALLVQLQMLVLQLQQQLTRISSESAALESGVLTSSTSILTCDAFFAQPTTIVSGATSTLFWKTTGAVRVSIDHNVANVLPPNGHIAILPRPATTTYTPNFMLTAFDGNGRSVTCFTKVTITPPPLPVCASFTVSTTSVTAGDSVKLKWEVKNASTVTINNNVGVVTGTSTKVIPAQTTTYTLTATNSAGAVVTCSTPKITVYTVPQCTSFTVNPSSIVSGTSTKLSWKTSGAVSGLIDNEIGRAHV